MPFIAVDPDDNRPRIPVEVDDGEEVQCPVCDGTLRVRDSSTFARHFYHPPDSSDCKGESNYHIAMKSIAVDKLRTKYPDAKIEIEFTADTVPRRADVFVEFDDPRCPLGRGIAVEVQYRNDQKNLIETTASFLDDGASVIWLFEEDYEGDRPNYGDVQLPQPIPVWPHGVPHGEKPSPGTSTAARIGIDEEDLVSFHPDHVDGQLSFGEFSDKSRNSETDLADSGWSLEREIHLNLSTNSVATQKFHSAWMDGRIDKRINQHRDTMEDRRKEIELANRSTYINNRFWKGDGDTFEFSMKVNPWKDDRFLIRQFVGGSELQILTSFDESMVGAFNRFVKKLVYELDCVHEFNPQSRNQRPVVRSSVGSISYTLIRTGTDVVLAKASRSNTSLYLTFNRDHLEALIDLCTKINLWYSQPPTDSN